jgi:acyl carrier protein
VITERDILDILSRCRSITIDVDRLKASIPLNEQGMDSLDISVFMFELESKLSIPIPTSEIGSLHSITDFVNYFNKHMETQEKLTLE